MVPLRPLEGNQRRVTRSPFPSQPMPSQRQQSGDDDQLRGDGADNSLANNRSESRSDLSQEAWEELESNRTRRVTKRKSKMQPEKGPTQSQLWWAEEEDWWRKSIGGGGVRGRSYVGRTDCRRVSVLCWIVIICSRRKSKR